MTRLLVSIVLAVLCGPFAARANDARIQKWIDQDTGHRVVRVSSEPYSTLPYFTANTFSTDRKFMVYSSPKGLHLTRLEDWSTQLLVPAKGVEIKCIEMGRRSNRLYYAAKRAQDAFATLESIDIHTRQVIRHAEFPPTYRIESINADESLAAGVVEKREPSAGPASYKNKADKLYNRFDEQVPMTLFSVGLADGRIRDIYKSTEWLSHPQFSPADPGQLMYSLEGPWHLVDRIWTIRSDGSERRLVHPRTTEMEIAGHEFWSRDGSTIVYDWQRPKGRAFYLASYALRTGERSAIPLDRRHWSLHFNASSDPLLFVGDGADVRQVARSPNAAFIYVYRFKPADAAPIGAIAPAATTATSAQVDKLVDLRGHDYRALEPNARLTPNNDWVLFRSNMFGAPGVFAVEVKTAGPGTDEVLSTYDLSTRLKARYRGILMLDQ